MANKCTAWPEQELAMRPGLATMAEVNASPHLRLCDDFIVRELASLAAQRILEAPVRVRAGSERLGRWRFAGGKSGPRRCFCGVGPHPCGDRQMARGGG